MGKYAGLIAVVLASLFAALAQFMWKQANPDVSVFVLLNILVLSGFVVYGLSYLLVIFALHHLDVSVVFPIMSLGFVWAFALSFLFLGESITAVKVFGLVFVLFGVSLVGGAS